MAIDQSRSLYDVSENGIELFKEKDLCVLEI